MKRILIGCPVRQKPAILRECLRSLSDLQRDGLALEFFFIDDNQEPESSELLRRFQSEQEGTTIEVERNDESYVCDDVTHRWNETLIWKVARFKDRIISEAQKRRVDALFLLDSDLVLAPQLLVHLASREKDIVSAIFWTKWEPDAPYLPQVWLSDRYTLFQRRRDEDISQAVALGRAGEFLKLLRRPGLHRVGGLGACTLISRGALERGVSFAEIDNLSFWGEDRHFCVRARALGLELWVDTRYPALHLYRESDIARAESFRARARADFHTRPKLTLTMSVHNEADRWLRDVLRAARPFIHEAVIIDDASTDNTVDVLKRELEGIPLHITRNNVSRFANEVELRRQQWDQCLLTNPDWLLFLDADDVLEHRARAVIPDLIQQTDYSVFGFDLYDFWSPTHYRDDHLWCAHKNPRPFLLRYTPDLQYEWQDTAQHCGRMPSNVLELSSACIDLRVKHMGWSDPEDRSRKYARYKELDPGARFGIGAQYESILDPSPNLVAWQD